MSHLGMEALILLQKETMESLRQLVDSQRVTNGQMAKSHEEQTAQLNQRIANLNVRTGDINMAVSYKRLWKLLEDKEMSKSDLRKKAEIAPNTMTKLRRDEEVSLTILSKICKMLNADFGDIVEYVPDAEIWELYDENRELIGRDHVRGEQLPIDGYHLVVHVWIRNSKGEYLISQRSANRPTYPLMWECVGGSVVKGEDSLLGAIREAKEEVGVDLNPENGQVLFTKTRKIIDGKIFNDIMEVWLFEYDGDVDLSNATTDEVAQAAWMNREQIKELFVHNMFVETLEYFFAEVDKPIIGLVSS